MYVCYFSRVEAKPIYTLHIIKREKAAVQTFSLQKVVEKDDCQKKETIKEKAF